MIKLSVLEPTILQGFLGTYESTPPRVCTRGSCVTSGTEAERFTFRRHYEQIEALLRSLEEVGCNASVTCLIKNGEFQSSGFIRLWFNGAEQTFRQALAHLNDFGWQAARASKASTAELQVTVTKTILRKVG